MIAKTTIQKKASLEKISISLSIWFVFFFRQVTPDISDSSSLGLMQNDMASGPGLPGLYPEDPCMAYLFTNVYISIEINEM